MNILKKRRKTEIPARLNISLSEIILPSPSPRVFAPGETVALAASIERIGQLCPICVKEKGGSFYLLDGERRIRALMLLNAQHADACVIKTSLSREQFFLAVHSGAPVHPVEYAHIIDRVKKAGGDFAALNIDCASAAELSAINSLNGRMQKRLLGIPPKKLPPIGLLSKLASLAPRDSARALELLTDRLNNGNLLETLLDSENQAGGIYKSLRATQLYADNRLYLNSLMDILRALERNGCIVECEENRNEDYTIRIRPAKTGEQIHMNISAKAI